MTRVITSLLCSLCVLVVVVGCSKPAADPKAATKVEPPSMGAETDEAAEIAKAMGELPEAERAVAMAQKVCPVGGGALGSMGMPYKVTVKGRDVFLCCKGCKDSIESDPDKYLAKLDEAGK